MRKSKKKTKALRRLTIEEKELRHTRQKAYDPKVRDLAAIHADIEQTNETLDSLRFTAKEAGKSIRRLGVVVPSGPGAVSTVKPNPSIRVLDWAMAAIKRLQRDLVFLREEEQLALEAQRPVDPDFEGLD